MTLFYLPALEYCLSTDNAKHLRIADDVVEFIPRTAYENDLVHGVMMEGLAKSEMEIQVHMHHEHLTKTTVDQNDVHRKINESTNDSLDITRFKFILNMTLDQIRHDTDLPLERWAFVHGMWALNASDPSVCNIKNELSLLMSAGCWGDFSFPAGRQHCDPVSIESPYTCRPVMQNRAYDAVEADLRPAQAGLAGIGDDRFFVWNSVVKHTICSLDYYSQANVDRLKRFEENAFQLIKNSPVIGSTMFIKTHAHSMAPPYREPDAPLPHLYPDVVKTFELIESACDAANVDFQCLSVDQVMQAIQDELTKSSQNGGAVDSQEASRVRSLRIPAVWNTNAVDRIVPTLFSELTNLHVEFPELWSRLGNYYTQRIESGAFIQNHDHALARYIARNFSTQTVVVEIGSGIGELGYLLSSQGFRYIGVEGDDARFELSTRLKEIFDINSSDPSLLKFVHGDYLELSDSVLPKNEQIVAVTTSLSSSGLEKNVANFLLALSAYPELLITTSHFTRTRDTKDQAQLISQFNDLGFSEIDEIEVGGDRRVIYFDRVPLISTETGTREEPQHSPNAEIPTSGSSVPSVKSTPFHVFFLNTVPIASIFPRFAAIPESWRPSDVTFLGLPVAAQDGHQDESNVSVKDDHFVFAKPGGYCVASEYGVFKALIVPNELSGNERILEIFRFYSANIIHSSADKSIIAPIAKNYRYVRPDYLLEKLFRSDQPLQLHCDHATDMFCYAVSALGYRARRAWVIDPAINSGHVVAEVYLPGYDKWAMFDTDFGCRILNSENVPMSCEEIVAAVLEDRLICTVDRVVHKHWMPDQLNFHDSFQGQISWNPGLGRGGETVSGDSYTNMLKKYFKMAHYYIYNFDDLQTTLFEVS